MDRHYRRFESDETAESRLLLPGLHLVPRRVEQSDAGYCLRMTALLRPTDHLVSIGWLGPVLCAEDETC